MSKGWIKLHRILLDKPIWQKSTPEQKVILITLLMMANHKESEWEWQGEKFSVRPGQMVTSLESIRRECGKGITIQNIRTALNRFKKYGFLTNESTKTGRLITIVNWEIYQGGDDETNKEDSKDLTKSQQRPNKDLTPNKNDKNDKEDIYILTENEERFLNTLSQVENYPLDRNKDLEMYKALANRYPKLDLNEAIEQWRVYKLDKPLTEKSNPRSQINMAFKKYLEWGKCLKGGVNNGSSADQRNIGRNDGSWGGSIQNSKLFTRKLK